MTDDRRYDPDLHAAVDRLVSAWPNVRSKRMFGHPGWVVDGKMFASIFGSTVVVRRLDGDPSESSDNLPHAPFQAYGRTMTGWAQVSVDPAEVSRLEPWLAASFRAAREAA